MMLIFIYVKGDRLLSSAWQQILYLFADFALRRIPLASSSSAQYNCSASNHLSTGLFFIQDLGFNPIFFQRRPALGSFLCMRSITIAFLHRTVIKIDFSSSNIFKVFLFWCFIFIIIIISGKNIN